MPRIAIAAYEKSVGHRRLPSDIGCNVLGHVVCLRPWLEL
jgi:hypothetical protein